MGSCGPGCLHPTPTQAHCAVCHQTFGGVSGFDEHRVDGTCRDPEVLGMTYRGGAWRRPITAEELARIRRNRDVA